MGEDDRERNSKVSILVVDKYVDPLDQAGIAEHQIYGVTYFLQGLGFRAELVWELSSHRFLDFNSFCKGIIEELERKKVEAIARDKDDLWAERWYEEKRGFFLEITDILRREPINSVEDLEMYDVFVAHASLADWDGLLRDVWTRYKDKWIIQPIETSQIPGFKELAEVSFKMKPLPFHFAERNLVFDGEKVCTEGYVVGYDRFDYDATHLVEWLIKERMNKRVD